MRNSTKENKMSYFIIFLYLLVGSFFYFAYYILMTDYFKVNPFDFPYLILSFYFIFAVVLFPYSGNKVSSWLENKGNINSFITSKISMPIAYIIAPLIFIFQLFKNIDRNN